MAAPPGRRRLYRLSPYSMIATRRASRPTAAECDTMLSPTPATDGIIQEPLLQAIGITKRYGTFLANDAIDLDLRPREIHALLGENGAGKSTLVKIMYGLIQPSGGELRWMGEKLELAGPADARALGIGMVFQHFSLFENLTVAENVALGLAPTESLRRDLGAARRSLAGLRAAARSQARGLAALGRRAPAHRDRARADAEPEAAHPRRADRGAHAAGSRPALHRARAPQERRTRASLHQPQARRGEAPVRQGDHPARRQEGRDLRSAPRDRGIAGPHDGGRRHRRGEDGVGPRDRAGRG